MGEQYRQRVEEITREMIRRGKFDNPVNPNRDARLDRNIQDDRDLRYSIRDISTFDGKGDSLPQTHMMEFGDFLTLDQKLGIYPKSHKQMIENITWQWLKM